MCTQGRFIYNKYIKKDLFVDCGHCPACEQNKAYKRMMRIYDECAPHLLGFFVTLSYARDYCPYFRREDFLNKVNPLPIYRDMKLVKGLGTSHYVHEVEFLDEVFIDDWYNNLDLPHLAYRSHNIGVCYYADVQNFIKRVRIYLKRHYNYDGYFKFFACSEYGESSARPHFHLEIFVNNEPFMYEKLQCAVFASWKMCSVSRWKKGFQLADDPASYISSYVNSPTVVSEFLKNNFRSKHSFSKYFGFNCKSYSLDSLLKKIQSGYLQYARNISPTDVPNIVNLPIPKYVVNRYFPIFKGYSRLTSSEVYDVLRSPVRLRKYQQELDYSEEDIISIITRLRHVKDKYFSDYLDEDYAILHISAWTSYRSTCYRLFMESSDDLTYQKYDNIYELVNGSVSSDLVLPENFVMNPNEFSGRVKKTNKLTQDFYQKTKNKKVIESINIKITNYE